jgi:hypothetical protein
VKRGGGAKAGAELMCRISWSWMGRMDVTGTSWHREYLDSRVGAVNRLRGLRRRGDARDRPNGAERAGVAGVPSMGRSSRGARAVFKYERLPWEEVRRWTRISRNSQLLLGIRKHGENGESLDCLGFPLTKTARNNPSKTYDGIKGKSISYKHQDRAQRDEWRPH